MTATAQYARQTDFHASPFRRTTSHDAAMKACGFDASSPSGLPHAPAVCVPCIVPSRAPHGPYVCIFAPHAFCVDESPRLTAWTRIAPQPSSHRQPHAQHITLPFFAAYTASIASPRTTPLLAVYCSRRLKHAPAVLHARAMAFPIAGAAFIPSSRAKRVSSEQDFPRPRAYLQPDTDHPDVLSTWAVAPIACTAMIASPPSPAPHRPPLEASSCPVRHREYCMEHQGSAQPVPRSLTVPRAAPIASLRAAPRRRRRPLLEISTSRTRRGSHHYAARLPRFERGTSSFSDVDSSRVSPSTGKTLREY
ncbi:hypothetical protein B0H14DRAFT_3873229 [Mycena olivaceomarginata]|nr:hypothetical protein B0H14DRAFT_3873229 [Mycena olivaceomarginata]